MLKLPPLLKIKHVWKLRARGGWGEGDVYDIRRMVGASMGISIRNAASALFRTRVAYNDSESGKSECPK